MEVRWGRSTWIFALNLGLMTYSHQHPSTQLVSKAPWKYSLLNHGSEEASTAEDTAVSL